MIAAINNKTDLLNELLNAPGIKIDKKSGDGKTAVFLAEENKSNAAVTELLKNNANIDIKPTNLRRYKDTNISMDDRDEYETDAIAESTIIDNLRSKKNQISQRRSTNGGKKSRRRKTKRSKKTRRSRR
jgi:ankyrin repeat protein